MHIRSTEEAGDGRLWVASPWRPIFQLKNTTSEQTHASLSLPRSRCVAHRPVYQLTGHTPLLTLPAPRAAGGGKRRLLSGTLN